MIDVMTSVAVVQESCTIDPALGAPNSLILCGCGGDFTASPAHSRDS